MLYATWTGASPVGLAGPGGVTADDVALLQEAAETVVFDEGIGIAYRWEEAGPDDTGGEDTGGDTGADDSGAVDSGAVDSGAGDSGAGDSGEPASPGRADSTGEGPCGCGSGSAAVLLLPLLVARRRWGAEDLS